MIQRLRIAFFLILLGCVVLPFQNCSFTGLRGRNNSANTTGIHGGGDGYPGKVLINRGDCGDGHADVSSIIREVAPYQFEVIRENCVDLPTPRPLSDESLIYSSKDRSIALHDASIFDHSISGKVTLAYCSGSQNSEVVIWRDSLETSAETIAHVYVEGVQRTFVLNGSSPEAVGEKLIYIGQAENFELTLARTGGASELRFLDEGIVRSLNINCHSQASPDSH